MCIFRYMLHNYITIQVEKIIQNEPKYFIIYNESISFILHFSSHQLLPVFA